MLIPKEVTKALEGLDETKALMQNMNQTLLQVLVLLSEQNEILRDIRTVNDAR